MAHYLCREKYKLELHWDKIDYLDEESAVLKGAYFSGPALKIAQKVSAPDKIDLDLTPQHIVVLNSYYIVRLTWDEVEYKDTVVLLKNAVVSNSDLKTLHKLENDDYVVISTEKHEEKIHAYNLVYESQVIRRDKEPYTYTK